MAIKTRKPTGKPSWPIILLTGGEKVGKSYSAAAASASEHVGRTFWIGIGEDDPDEYGAIPGARFEIVEHDGTYRGILNAVDAAAAEPADGAPNVIVLDSATRLWNLLCDMAQNEADERAKRKQRKVGPDGADISMDLWNLAAQRWTHIMDALRAHHGPVLITARQDVVTVIGDDGKPTKDKDRKVQAHKSLPFDVAAIVEFRAFGDAYLTGVKSLKITPDVSKPLGGEFTVEQLWRWLGVLDGDVSERRHADVTAEETAPARPAGVEQAEPQSDEDMATWEALIDAAESVEALQDLWRKARGLPDVQAAINSRALQMKNASEAANAAEDEPSLDVTPDRDAA
ncbi:AAA family ATPase [Cumulibacter soli]|uniref:AAA family ATPase n=1 Tax=Cumulibacter soli TaxID=2546344 RepID=UPI001067C7D6|nr:AAA family ATPase [Cumulibacter soli]